MKIFLFKVCRDCLHFDVGQSNRRFQLFSALTSLGRSKNLILNNISSFSKFHFLIWANKPLLNFIKIFSNFLVILSLLLKTTFKLKAYKK